MALSWRGRQFRLHFMSETKGKEKGQNYRKTFWWQMTNSNEEIAFGLLGQSEGH